jgi:hypothetical protein
MSISLPKRSSHRSLGFALSCGALIVLGNACSSDSTPQQVTAPGGAGPTAGATGSAGNAQNVAGGGTGGDVSTAAGSAGTSGTAGNSGAAGAGGGGTNARGYYSTNPAEFLGAPRCAGLDVQLCDDFESGSWDPATWELHQSAASDAPVIDTLHAARGSKAAHFHTANNEYSYILEKKTFPAVGNVFWGRMFLYIDALPVTPDGAHFTWLEAVGTGDPSKVREGGQYRKFGVGSDGGPTGDWTNIDQDPAPATVKEIPEKQWLCLEWQYKGDSDETHFYVDGVEHPSLHTFPAVPHQANSTVSYHLPQFTSIWLGWWLYQASPMPDHYDVWLDEVAIDRARIGCSL